MGMKDLAHNQWYPLFQSRELTQAPRRFTRFGEDYVAFRTAEGQPVMMADRCPHLGASLSLGRRSGDRLVCPFHGFEFAADGQCRHIPARGPDGPIPGALRNQTIPLTESWGLIFGWWGPGAMKPMSPPNLEAFDAGWHYSEISDLWPVHLTRAIENQLDVAHLPFVHRRSIGRGLDPQIRALKVESEETEIRIWSGHRRASVSIDPPPDKEDPPGIVFVYPGLWQLRIHQQLRLVVAFVPVSDQATRFYVRSCRRRSYGLLNPWVSWLFGLANRWVLGEDRKVVSSLTPSSSLDAKDVLLDADRAILEFRRNWRRLRDADNS